MQERLIQKYQRWNHIESIQKQAPAGICSMKKNIGDLVVTKDKLGKTSKPICLTKENYLKTNQMLARRDGNFCVERVIVKDSL